MRGDEGMKENELQEIERKVFKDEDGWNNYMNVSIEEMDWLISEVRRLNEVNEALLEMDENKHEIIEHYKQALEHIKEKTKHGQAYHIEGEVHYIAHRALEGEGE
jgi:hypothetical protein